MARLAIGVMATTINQKYQDQIRACASTWCKEALQFQVPVYFFGGHLSYPGDSLEVDGKSLSYINLPGVQEDYNSAFDKQFYGLRYLLEKVPADFYMIIGTDTYLQIPNVLKLLDKYDHKKDYYIGGHGCHQPHQNMRLLDGYNVYYMSGGAGFILTKVTTVKIVSQIEEIKCEWPTICARNSKSDLLPACDVALAYYLHKMSIFPTVEKGFYPYTSHGQYEHVVIDRQMNLDTLISCHYMTPTLMEEYNAYRRHCIPPEIKQGWTLITALYHPFASSNKLLSLPYSMIVFCDPVLYPEIWQARREHLNQTYFVPLKLESQWDLLAKGLDINPFRSTHFVWIASTIADLSALPDILGTYRDKTTLLCVDYSIQDLPLGVVTGHREELQKLVQYRKDIPKILRENLCELTYGSLTNYQEIRDCGDIILNRFICPARADSNNHLAYDACHRLYDSFSRGICSLSPRNIVQLHIEYFIASWWTDRKSQCVDIVQQLASQCKNPTILEVATPQAKYLITQTDFIQHVIKDKPRLEIRRDQVSLDDYEKHLSDHHVFIYGEYPFSSASFYTANPVIRPLHI